MIDASPRVPRRHALRQLTMVRALLSAVVVAALRRQPEAMDLPGPVAHDRVAPRADALVRDYIRHCGGDVGAYGATVPAHLFPQWGFPLLATTLRAVPYDLRKALNGGCRMEIRAPIPAGEPLLLEACLEDIDDNARRAVLKNRITTGTAGAPAALTAWMYVVVPLPGRSGGSKKDKPTVPGTAQLLTPLRLTPRHGRDFAVLTGDFNPIHWLAPYARMAGFPSTILHGFATFAYAIEALNTHRFGGDPTRLRTIDVKFTKPVVLPAGPSVFVDGDQIFVGDAAGEPAYLTGTFEEASTDG